MYDLSINLLGSPQITRGNQPITLQRKKDLALLAYLAVTDRAQTRDSLAALLWPDSGQDAARANVRKNISRLKGELGSDTLLTQHDEVRFNPNLSLQLDVRQFQLHVEQPKKHNHFLHGNTSPLCEACRSALEEAVRLYRGEFLAGFNLPDSSTFDEWQFFQSEGYRQNLGMALQYLIQEHLQLAEYDPVIEYSRKWLALDVFNEPAHRQLMLAYALGGQQAAALRQFAECSRLLKEELGTEPEPDTVELHEAIRAKKINRQKADAEKKIPLEKIESQDVSAPAQKTKITHNLPITTTPFIGRAQELGRLKELLDDPACRIVSLLGPGGSGKTRLAIQAGSTYVDGHIFQDGVWFVQLAPLKHHASIIPAIQDGLKLAASFGQENPRQQIFNYLRKRQALLILDNFEHLLQPESITLITDLIQHAPHIKLLITSRERLNVQGEYLFLVEGLTTPTEEALLSGPGAGSEQVAFASIQLFEQSARRVQPSFAITNDNARIIVRICRYLQGMPLAIELAAAWVEALSVTEIHREIKRDLDFLQSELHDTPDRQRSLRAVFDTSWTKLSQPTRSTIKALSVFRSNFSREAAQAITGLSAKTLLELVNKSWIQTQKNGKYQIHELLRQFACEALESEPVTFAQVREKYCSYYANRLALLWEMSKGSEQSKVYEELDFEFENIKTAWAWLEEQGDYETMVNKILPALFAYSEIRGKSIEMMGMCERAFNELQKNAPTAVNNKLEIILRTAHGAFWGDGHPLRYEFFEGVFPIHMDSIQRAWDLSQKSVGFHDLGHWGVLLAFVYGHLSPVDMPIRQLEQTLDRFQKNNNLWELANARMHLAMLYMIMELDDQKKNAIARTHLTEALSIFKSLGDAASLGQVLRQMGNLSLREQNIKEAIRQWKAARASLLAVDVNEWVAASSIDWQIGNAYLQQGQFKEAFQCFQQVYLSNIEHGFVQLAIGALSKESFEKARYGDLEDAIKIRRQSLELIQQTELDYLTAWNFWEMGEMMRLAGNPDEAVELFERSFKLFEIYEEDKIGFAFYWRGLGDILLEKQDWAEAANAFQKSVELANQIHHQWAAAYALNGLGRAELYMSKIELSTDHILAALDLARKVHDPGVALTILDALSELHARKENFEKAAVLNALTLQHFASWNEIKRRATRLSMLLKDKLLPREFNELKKKGRSSDLWSVVDQELAGFKDDA
jgi:predicted ATPase/DNA-binding SARP family transcriptional activator